MTLIRKSIEQIRKEASANYNKQFEVEKRNKLYLDEQTRKQNEVHNFAMHLGKAKEDKITKSVLNTDQAYEEYEKMLSNNGLANDSGLKDKMRKVLGDNETSSFHVRLITDYVEYLLHQHKHVVDRNKVKKSEVKIY